MPVGIRFSTSVRAGARTCARRDQTAAMAQDNVHNPQSMNVASSEFAGRPPKSKTNFEVKAASVLAARLSSAGSSCARAGGAAGAPG